MVECRKGGIGITALSRPFMVPRSHETIKKPYTSHNNKVLNLATGLSLQIQEK